MGRILTSLFDPSSPPRYAELLVATMAHIPSPTVKGITPEQLAEFCMDSGYSCQLESAGSFLAPPGYNVRVTDWERASRLWCGEGPRVGLQQEIA